MSKVEKRKFKLSTKKQSGKKDYLSLFEIVDENTSIDPAILRQKFKRLCPRSSIDNSARYLLKIITDGLIQTKIKDDNLFRLYYGFLQVQVLQTRSLGEESYKELKKLQHLAVKSQNPVLQYIFYRFELNYLSDLNFNRLTEKNVIEMQMKARDALKDMRNTHEHHSLYELLKYRLAHSGKIISEEKKKDLNDLILNEMSLVTGRGKNNFESQKLHLLFQSFFFTDIGDYKSALKTFHVLNKLFEQNISIWNYPPLDYFSSLDGILDSLRAIENYIEMEFYIKKMEKLDNKSYPEFFSFLVQKTVMIYQLSIFIGVKEYERAIDYINKSDPALLKTYNMADDEKQSELIFYLGLVFFKVKNFKRAQKYINQVVLIQKINYQSMVYKASRLLNILINYEDKNLQYLEYEIRSYKRPSRNKEKLLKTETIVFTAIKLHPDKNSAMKNELLWAKISPKIKNIENDKYEMQLRKYFDFTGWIKNKFKK